ncbi:hypothetical protein QQX98_006372 [Neonectria punicea]|uniref:Uncharacterized protein n=1 Tax=Neonectria punicea TaxID=979145 RepID=A0ABR1H0Z5_9HYPO
MSYPPPGGWVRRRPPLGTQPEDWPNLSPQEAEDAARAARREVLLNPIAPPYDPSLPILWLDRANRPMLDRPGWVPVDPALRVPEGVAEMPSTFTESLDWQARLLPRFDLGDHLFCPLSTLTECLLFPLHTLPCVEFFILFLLDELKLVNQLKRRLFVALRVSLRASFRVPAMPSQPTAPHHMMPPQPTARPPHPMMPSLPAVPSHLLIPSRPLAIRHPMTLPHPMAPPRPAAPLRVRFGFPQTRPPPVGEIGGDIGGEYVYVVPWPHVPPILPTVEIHLTDDENEEEDLYSAN